MGNHHRGFGFHQLQYGLLDKDLVFGVEAGRGFVEQYNRCIFQQGAGNTDALLLPTGQLAAAFQFPCSGDLRAKRPAREFPVGVILRIAVYIEIDRPIHNVTVTWAGVMKMTFLAVSDAQGPAAGLPSRSIGPARAVPAAANAIICFREIHPSRAYSASRLPPRR